MRWLLPVVAFLLFGALNNCVNASLSYRNSQNHAEDDAKSKSESKSESKGGKGKPPPINQLCFTKLAGIWWSWFFCYYDTFLNTSNSCPPQDDKHIPANTTFLWYDNQNTNCTNFTPNERSCMIPAKNWIVLNAGGLVYSTDFVSPGNEEDTPELMQSITRENIENIDTIVTVTPLGGNTTTYDPPPPYESQDLCNLEMLDLKGCTSSRIFADNWYIYSNAHWLRLPPQNPGTYIIEVEVKYSWGNCSGTKYTITAV